VSNVEGLCAKQARRRRMEVLAIEISYIFIFKFSTYRSVALPSGVLCAEHQGLSSVNFDSQDSTIPSGMKLFDEQASYMSEEGVLSSGTVSAKANDDTATVATNISILLFLHMSCQKLTTSYM